MAGSRKSAGRSGDGSWAGIGRGCALGTGAGRFRSRALRIVRGKRRGSCWPGLVVELRDLGASEPGARG
jgi:hypothetical protein